MGSHLRKMGRNRKGWTFAWAFFMERGWTGGAGTCSVNKLLPLHQQYRCNKNKMRKKMHLTKNSWWRFQQGFYLSWLSCVPEKNPLSVSIHPSIQPLWHLRDQDVLRAANVIRLLMNECPEARRQLSEIVNDYCQGQTFCQSTTRHVQLSVSTRTWTHLN